MSDRPLIRADRIKSVTLPDDKCKLVQVQLESGLLVTYKSTSFFHEVFSHCNRWHMDRWCMLIDRDAILSKGDAKKFNETGDRMVKAEAILAPFPFPQEERDLTAEDLARVPDFSALKVGDDLTEYWKVKLERNLRRELERNSENEVKKKKEEACDWSREAPFPEQPDYDLYRKLKGEQKQESKKKGALHMKSFVDAGLTRTGQEVVTEDMLTRLRSHTIVVTQKKNGESTSAYFDETTQTEHVYSHDADLTGEPPSNGFKKTIEKYGVIAKLRAYEKTSGRQLALSGERMSSSALGNHDGLETGDSVLYAFRLTDRKTKEQLPMKEAIELLKVMEIPSVPILDIFTPDDPKRPKTIAEWRAYVEKDPKTGLPRVTPKTNVPIEGVVISAWEGPTHFFDGRGHSKQLSIKVINPRHDPRFKYHVAGDTGKSKSNRWTNGRGDDRRGDFKEAKAEQRRTRTSARAKHTKNRRTLNQAILIDLIEQFLADTSISSLDIDKDWFECSEAREVLTVLAADELVIVTTAKNVIARGFLGDPRDPIEIKVDTLTMSKFTVGPDSPKEPFSAIEIKEFSRILHFPLVADMEENKNRILSAAETVSPTLKDRFVKLGNARHWFGGKGFGRFLTVTENFLVDFIPKLPGFKKFMATKIKALDEIADNKSARGKKGGIKKHLDLYRALHAGKTIITIDLREANFSALRRAGVVPAWCQSWRQFLSEVVGLTTWAETVALDKKLRQAVLSKVDQKNNLQTAWFNMIYEFFLDIKDRADTLGYRFIGMGTDEIAFEVPADTKSAAPLLAESKVYAKQPTDFNVQLFRLHRNPHASKEATAASTQTWFCRQVYEENLEPLSPPRLIIKGCQVGDLYDAWQVAKKTFA